MVPTDEAKITFGMLYSVEVPAAIALVLLAILPPEKLCTNWIAFLPPSQRLGCATLCRRSSNRMERWPARGRRTILLNDEQGIKTFRSYTEPEAKSRVGRRWRAAALIMLRGVRERN